MPEIIQPNLFSMGSLITAIFTAFVAFLFFRIEKRSRASTSFAITLLWMFGFHAAYAFGALVLLPQASFNRWLALTAALAASAQFLRFFFQFPEEYSRKTGTIWYWVLMSICIVFMLYFMVTTVQAPTHFIPSGHYFDFFADKPNRLSSLMVLLFFANVIIAGIWSIIRCKREDRSGLLLLFVAFIVLSIVPGALNTMSRDGKVERGTFYAATVLFNIVGFFIMSIAYINMTKDKTTFMAKIVSISMLTLLLSFYTISMFTLNEADRVYDLLKNQESTLAAKTGERPADLAYSVGYRFNNRQLTSPTAYLEQKNISLELLQASFFNTGFYHQLKQLVADGKTGEERHLLSVVPPSFMIYRDYLNQACQAGCSAAEILEKIHLIQKTMRLEYIKLERLSPVDYAENAVAYLEGAQKKTFVPLGSAIEFLKNTELEGLKLKNTLLAMFLPVHPPGSRHYRGKFIFSSKEGTPEYFVSYITPYWDKGELVLMEFGYPYLSYRQFISQAAWPIVWVLLSVVVFVLVGFRSFFLGSLIRPLDALLEGLREVNKGNLDARVPIKVEDEIGFLARSFNRMVRSIQAARKRLQRYAEELEDKVRERTAELQKTLDQVQELKAQQDGDYFLTTLLIKPLGVNSVDNEFTDIDFLIKQKKEFLFRQWKRDIGGDLNIANNIELRGKKYSVVLNADAMGKSMQGAGGALVLGAVFHSIIERVHLVASEREQYPEKWLKNAFIEMHKVFSSFDGSMLISLVICLIEEDSGLMYYINAEHPNPVLYRDKVASFIEPQAIFRKLGSALIEGMLHIETFQLKQGDVVILGSDGRDDIMIGTEEDGTRIINEDENLFLKVVVEADGDLQRIEKILRQRGEITDDLSLIRIFRHEKGQSQRVLPPDVIALVKQAREVRKKGDLNRCAEILEQAYEIDNTSPEVIRELLRIYIDIKNYRRSAELCEDYLVLRPGDNEVLYIASYCYRKIGKFKEAADLGERLRLRDPWQVKNLVHLSDIHRRLGNRNRARHLLEEAVKVDPENAGVIRRLDLESK